MHGSFWDILSPRRLALQYDYGRLSKSAPGVGAFEYKLNIRVLSKKTAKILRNWAGTEIVEYEMKFRPQIFRVSSSTVI